MRRLKLTLDLAAFRTYVIESCLSEHVTLSLGNYAAQKAAVMFSDTSANYMGVLGKKEALGMTQ